ncbi:MAG: TrkA family potassium uptake protein, partial [Candidatus Cloacimonetes bacterium]|nr:TrkA family potassium uptake protein [Candidatus Cloacimonadota bacterium]
LNNIQDVDGVILSIGNNIEVSVLTAVILKKLGVGNIYAKVDSKIHARILELMGIQNIVFPEEQIGEQIANSLLSKNILKYVDLTSGHSVIEFKAPEKWEGKTLQELALPTKMRVNVVAIKYIAQEVTEDGENKMQTKINELPGANDVINHDDVLVLIGPKVKINELITSSTK